VQHASVRAALLLRLIATLQALCDPMLLLVY
jgi:hypothetical protein